MNAIHQSLNAVKPLGDLAESTFGSRKGIIRPVEVGSDEFLNKLTDRQHDRFSRVKAAKKKHALRWLGLILAYFFGFTFLFMALCTEEDEEGNAVHWSFHDAFYYMSVSTTTVGYGDFHFLEKSVGVKVLFIFQSLCGICILSMYVVEGQLTQRAAEMASGFIVRAPGEETHPDLDFAQRKTEIRNSCIKVLTLWLAGTLFYEYYEGMDAETAFYFSTSACPPSASATSRRPGRAPSSTSLSSS